MGWEYLGAKNRVALKSHEISVKAQALHLVGPLPIPSTKNIGIELHVYNIGSRIQVFQFERCVLGPSNVNFCLVFMNFR